MVVHVEYGAVPSARREPDVMTVPIAALKRKPSRPVSQAHVDWLAESFGEVGQLHPILIDPEQNVLAGEHRIQAAEKRGWAQINALILGLDQLRAQLATLDENLVRHEGTELERSEALRQRKEIYEAIHPSSAHGGAPGLPGGGKAKAANVASFAEDAATKTGQSERSVQRRVKVAEDLDPQAKEAIAATPIADSITDLEQLAKLEPEQQRKVAKRAAAEGTSVKRAAKDVRREEQIKLVKKYVPPAGKYPVVMRDPAWPYEDQLEGDGARGGTPYPQNSIEGICAQVPPADDDCVLFLCVTNGMLVDDGAPVQQVLRAWGFTGKALITWKKDRMGLGRYARNITEHIVVAVKGNPVLDLPENTTWFEAPRGEHSEKPEKLYELIEQLCPARPIFEGDARERAVDRPGWVRSGAELAAPATALANEGPAHQWQRENPLSAPARALYRCLLCDAKHRGQETPPPYGPCRSKELSPSTTSAAPSKPWTVEWRRKGKGGLAHAYGDPGMGGRSCCDRPAEKRPNILVSLKGAKLCGPCKVVAVAEARAGRAEDPLFAIPPAGGTSAKGTPWYYQWWRQDLTGASHAFQSSAAAGGNTALKSECGEVDRHEAHYFWSPDAPEKPPRELVCLTCLDEVAGGVREHGAVDPLRLEAADLFNGDLACCVCGCTEGKACGPELGGPCWWVHKKDEPPLCSSCAAKSKRPESSLEIADLIADERTRARLAELRQARKKVRLTGKREPIEGRRRCESCGEHRTDVEHLSLQMTAGTECTAYGLDLCPPCQTPIGVGRAWENRRSGKSEKWLRQDERDEAQMGREAAKPEVLAASEFRRLAAELGFSQRMKVAGKNRQAFCFACHTRIPWRPTKHFDVPLAALELLRQHQARCPARQVREVKVKAGSLRIQIGGECSSVANRTPGAKRCKHKAQAVVKGAGRLWSVCTGHGREAMRGGILRVALEGAR